jgi:mRNA interferase MazF
VVQGDPLNRSRISTVVCVIVTSNLKWAKAPGDIRLSARESARRETAWSMSRRS